MLQLESYNEDWMAVSPSSFGDNLASYLGPERLTVGATLTCSSITRGRDWGAGMTSQCETVQGDLF